MRRRLRLPAVLVVMVGVVLTLSPTSAGAADLQAAGWWSRTSSPVPLNPTAPTAGEDQLVVQGEPGGANAIAALRWSLADGESSPVLTITSADGSVVPPEALILACKAGTPWTEASGAPLDEAPKVDCGTSVNGLVGEDGTITFALGGLVDGNVLDIVLTPGEDPDGGGSTFSLIFDRPAPDALATSQGGGDETAFDPGSSGSFSPDAGSGSFDDSFGGSGADAGSGSFTAPSGGGDSSFTAPATDAAPAAEPALPPENQVAMDTSAGTPVAAQPAGAVDRDQVRTLGIVVLLAGAALGAWSLMKESPARAGGGAPAGFPGAAAEGKPGGLGRFVRPRTGPPPSLS